MSGFLDQFRKRIVKSVWKDAADSMEAIDIDDKIALGVLLWVVAEADDEFLPEEKEKMKDILQNYGDVSDDDIPVIFESIEQAAKDRIDLHTFTQEVSCDLDFTKRMEIIENLFRVACIDNDLAHQEEEMIRKISGLFRLDHKDFIDAKIKVKKEFGMDTAGL